MIFAAVLLLSVIDIIAQWSLGVVIYVTWAWRVFLQILRTHFDILLGRFSNSSDRTTHVM